MRIKIFSVLLSLVFLINGCVMPEKFQRTLPPAYLAMLTNNNVRESYRCTAFIYNERYVVTAYHCLAITDGIVRIVTQYNQENYIHSYYYDKLLDIAVIKTTFPTYVEEYPKFDEPKYNVVGQAYGMCTRYMYFSPRYVLNFGLLKYHELSKKFIDDMDFDKTFVWYTVQDKFRICLGDSGGLVIQEGKIVGMTQVILAKIFTGIGNHVYALSGKEVERFIHEAIIELEKG